MDPSETIVGVMGPGGGATDKDKSTAYELGQKIAQHSWTLLTGGRSEGVMEASMKGAVEAGGTTIGILPGTSPAGMSDYVQIPIFTGMGHARNVINIHSSRLTFACGLGAGTSSEISLALKTGTPVILLRQSPDTITYYQQLSTTLLHPADDPDDAVAKAYRLL